MKKIYKKRAIVLFALALALLVAMLFASIIRTKLYNKKQHCEIYDSSEYLNTKVVGDYLVIQSLPRASTWGKIFDFNNEGITENNYKAYTYDFTIMNNTNDKVSEFYFVLTFDQEVFLSSAWNGSLEVHQYVNSNEYQATVPDMREFNKEEYEFDTVTIDGEDLIRLEAGDYLIYYPSTSLNAMEMPIGSHEATTPGIIMYVPMDDKIIDSTFEIQYKFHRILIADTMFWVSFIGFLMWLIILAIYTITYLQIRKYQAQHERDNKIIVESIETFTRFIDAKDPYTNGHSKRVASYTKTIAKELGFEGEELEHIYYIGLLHDCGKIGVPDNILDKPSKLTDEEFEIIKAHTIMGGEILREFKSLENVELGALFHHERYDGGGYPVGLVGEEIPYIARIICLADAYDAMNSNRVYRKRLDKEEIIRQIENNKGKQFDPKIADVVLDLIRNDKLDKEYY